MFIRLAPISCLLLFVLCLMASLSLQAAGSDHLYLLAATASISRVNIPVRLYTVESGTGTVTLIREIADGTSCVFADYERRRLVVASPSLNPTRFSLIDMDAPAKTVIGTRQTDNSKGRTIPESMYLLDLPGAESGVALALDLVPPTGPPFQQATNLAFVALDSSKPAISLPFEDLKYLRISGEVGGALTMIEAKVILRGNPLQIVVGAPGTKAQIGMGRPPYLAGRDPSYGFRLVLNDDRTAVLVPAEPGVVDIFNKTSGEWKRLPIPFPDARIRAFGSWLAMIEVRPSRDSKLTRSSVSKETAQIAHESPGADKRRSEQIAPGYRKEPGITVNDVFDEMHIGGGYFPGELAAYNVDTGTQLRISTGEGDSEIVLITDSTIYYRVDDALYSQPISEASPGVAVKLAQGPEIVQVHWAFLN